MRRAIVKKDREALKRPPRKRFEGSFKDIVKRILDPDLIWRFERVLRYTEYYSRNFEELIDFCSGGIILNINVFP